MKVVTHWSPRGVLRWTHRILFACAAGVLAYLVFALTDAWVFQDTEIRKIERWRAVREEARTTGSVLASQGPSPHAGGLSGRIEIPRLGVSAIIVEGTGRRDLRRAVGHISGTGLPGQPGNVGIAGHRDTFFRPLRNIRQDDIITLTTLFGDYRYRVVSFKVVGPQDVAVLDPNGMEVLTLVTCHPFYFVGSAPDRFIVRAERIA